MRFYIVSSDPALTRGYKPVELRPAGDLGGAMTLGLLKGDVQVVEPLALWVSEGDTWCDYHKVRPPQGAVMSVRVLEALRANGCTGWKDYGVKIIQNDASKSPIYRGICVIGVAKRLDRLGERMEVTRLPSGGQARMWKGYGVDERTWDGTDLFLTEGLGGIICASERLLDAIAGVPDVRGLRLTPIDEFEFMVRVSMRSP